MTSQRIVFKRCPECGVLSAPGDALMFQHDYECPHDCSDFDGFEDVAYVPEQPQLVAVTNGPTVTTTNWGCDCGRIGGHTPTCRVWSFPR